MTIRKNFTLQKIKTIRKSSGELWILLVTLLRGKQCKLLIKENGVISFDLKTNANMFCMFFSNLAASLLQNVHKIKYIGFTDKTKWSQSYLTNRVFFHFIRYCLFLDPNLSGEYMEMKFFRKIKRNLQFFL